MAISRLLFLTRPFSSKAFHFISSAALQQASVSFASEWRSVEDHWIMRDFYEAFESSASTRDLLQDISSPVVDDVILRCRYLRAVERPQARRMVGAMWRAATALLDRFNPQLVVSGYIDCYMYDIIARVQKQRGAAYVTICDSMLPEYGDINYRFFPIAVREPASEEVDALIERIRRPGFRPAYMDRSYYETDSFKRFWRLYLRDKGRRFYFALRKFFERDYLSFHLNTPDTYPCKELTWLRTSHFFRKDWREVLVDAKLPKVFIPLQYYPESKYDYSQLNPALRNVQDLTKALARILSPSCLVVLKEHPTVYGARNPQFYREILRYRNVIITPPHVDMREVNGLCDAVITAGSTIGLETLIRGGRVISVGKPSYYVPGYFDVIERLEDLELLPQMIRGRSDPRDHMEVARAIARKQLSNLLPGGCPYIGFSLDDKEQASRLEKFAGNFARHLDQIAGVSLSVPEDFSGPESALLAPLYQLESTGGARR
jgi:hypothetical protein